MHQVTGVWVYPVLERIAPLARVLFFSMMTFVICFLYTLGEILNSYIWDQTHTGTHTHTQVDSQTPIHIYKYTHTDTHSQIHTNVQR